MRRTLLLALFLLLIGATAAGTWSYVMWNRSDELLRKTMLERLEEMFPDYDITIARARLDFQGRIHAHGLRWTVGEARERFIDADEVIMTIDGGRLADSNPLVRRLEVVRPRVWLTRHASGDWNVTGLPPPRRTPGVLPEWNLSPLKVQLRVEREEGLEPLEHSLENASLQLSAIGRRQYKFRLGGRSSLAENLRLEGNWHLDARNWGVKGDLTRLRADDSLLDLLTEFSPEFQAGLRRSLEAIEARARSAGEVSEIARGEPEVVATESPLRLGISALGDLNLDLTKSGPEEPLEYRVRVQLHDGAITHPPLDFPLTDLQGRATIDNQRIEFREVTGRSGPIGVSIPLAHIENEGEIRPAHLELHLTELPLDDRVVALLPPAPRKIYLDCRPTGRVDVHVAAETAGAGPWQVEWAVNPRDCTARHVQFPYLVEGVEGEIAQREGVVRAELHATAGRQPVKFSGKTLNPGPEAESHYEITVEGMPIDSRLREAAPPPLQKVLDALQLQGTVGGKVTLHRPPGLAQPTTPTVDVLLKNGSLNPKAFSYSLSKASARIRGSGKSWTFTNCKGVHDRTPVTGAGSFAPDEDGVSRLALKFLAEDVRLDRALYEALPDDMRSLWYELNPEGSCHLDGTLDWVPGQGRPVVQLEAELLDASVALRSFPYPLRNIHCWVSVKPGKITLKELRGRHDETRLQCEAVATLGDDGEWRFRAEPLMIDDLDAGTSFRRALPGGLRSVVEAFDLRGDVSLSGMLELRGVRGGDYPITAAWNLTTVYGGNTVTAGVELQEMHGKTDFTGTWDGEAVRANGQLALNSVKVLGYQLQQVQGPIRIDNGQLILGSKNVLEQGNATSVADSERLTAQFIEGVLAVDALIRLGDKMSYDVRVGLRNGLLERFNEMYLSGQGRLAGVINGVVFLTGRGTDFRQLKGNGRMLIEPADLYDLPLILAVLRVLSLQRADAAAFDRAQFDFNVRNGLVVFDRINLQGESASLFGRGNVRMSDKRILFDFYSASGRRQVPIPVVRELANELTKGWVGIHVEGTLKDPRPETRPIPMLDDALKRLLGVFDNRPLQRR